ncbi:cobalt-zinc-cadmium efflux system membrane fusion protein [Oxalobacteraceae bacterium GrIS 1.11]
MISSTRFFKLALTAAAVGGAIAAFQYVRAEQESKPPAVARPATRPGLLSFAPNAPQLSSLKVVTVTNAALPVSDAVNGRIGYDENVTTRVSSPVAGRVLTLHAEIGDAVARGAVLAEIDSPELAGAEADGRKAQADELRKRLAFERAKTLFDGEVLARKDYELAEADYRQARAETTRARLRTQNLNAGGRDDGKFALKAALAGIVADKQINPGQEVRPDLPNPLFVISDLRHLWVIVDVPEAAAGALRQGQAVTIETDAYPAERFSARIARIALALDPVTRRVQVRCALDNADRRLKPEMFARVSFLAGDGDAKAVPLPNTSLFTEGAYSYVFVEQRAGSFEKRRVNVKVRGRERSFVDAGLAAGERVVTEGAFLLNAEVASDAQ